MLVTGVEVKPKYKPISTTIEFSKRIRDIIKQYIGSSITDKNIYEFREALQAIIKEVSSTKILDDYVEVEIEVESNDIEIKFYDKEHKEVELLIDEKSIRTKRRK
jgi:hypothetical protein